jgi:hypothetical protein
MTLFKAQKDVERHRKKGQHKYCKKGELKEKLKELEGLIKSYERYEKRTLKKANALASIILMCNSIRDQLKKMKRPRNHA